MNFMKQPPTPSKVISHAFFTGTARQCSLGPSIGHVDIGESGNAYFFRVSIPCLERNGNNIKCYIQRNGRVTIQGYLPEITIARDTGVLYRMQLQYNSPPGPFSVAFNLPGPVDPRMFKPELKPGIFEVVVKKLSAPTSTL